MATCSVRSSGTPSGARSVRRRRKLDPGRVEPGGRRPGDEQLVVAGQVDQPGRDVDVDPQPVRADALRAAGVQPGRSRGVTVDLDVGAASRAGDGVGRQCGSGKTAISPSPIRLTTCRGGPARGGSIAG